VKRTLSRVALSMAVVASLGVSLVQPAAARPRSWFLPSVNVACVDASGTGTFVGNMQLNAVEFVKGQLTVGGNIAGSCGSSNSLDTSFRTTIAVLEATCDEAVLSLGDITIKDTLVVLSEDPIVVEADGSGPLRGALCSLAKSASGSTRALVKSLNRVLSLQG
jgi:hypothetical protein